MFLHTTSLQSVCTFLKIQHVQTHTQMNVSRSLARLNLHIDWVCWKRWTSIAASLYFAEIKSLSTMQSYLIIFFPDHSFIIFYFSIWLFRFLSHYSYCCIISLLLLYLPSYLPIWIIFYNYLFQPVTSWQEGTKNMFPGL